VFSLINKIAVFASPRSKADKETHCAPDGRLLLAAHTITLTWAHTPRTIFAHAGLGGLGLTVMRTAGQPLLEAFLNLPHSDCQLYFTAKSAIEEGLNGFITGDDRFA
jgi:hypothetical protein